MLGLEAHLQRKPGALSGGQRQRVAVGRAIVRDPKCFLFDEPLSNLDARLRVETRTELKRIHLDLKSTTVYVTHDQEEAMTLGDRVVVMKDGVMQQCGSPLELYRHPVNRFVAGFVGTPPMNFVPGRLVNEGGKLQFADGDARLRVPEWAAPALGGRIGEEIVLGVRPQALALDTAKTADAGAQLAARVQLVEPLGDRMNVRFSWGSQKSLVAEIPAVPNIAPGQPLALAADLARVHFFDPGAQGQTLVKNTALA
jgi:multiple sugar transport system ATP-binding protein